MISGIELYPRNCTNLSTKESTLESHRSNRPLSELQCGLYCILLSYLAYSNKKPDI